MDDDQDDRFIFGEALELSGINANLKTFNGGEDFENYILSNPIKPDIIFLDLNLPRRHGFEILDDLKGTDRFKETTVLLYTTSDDENDVYKAKQRKASGFITKPTDFLKLEKIINQVFHNFYSATEPSGFIRL
ncbi:response regulator [Flavobacterium akiainvivens]|uniref:response regulator n=1 Tax=Flavobacterium akiainvivens TaxID=1202724 RepID=UPI0015A62917|nr:response regulator [Flavobacterium akiainvivens]